MGIGKIVNLSPSFGPSYTTDYTYDAVNMMLSSGHIILNKSTVNAAVWNDAVYFGYVNITASGRSGNAGGTAAYNSALPGAGGNGKVNYTFTTLSDSDTLYVFIGGVYVYPGDHSVSFAPGHGGSGAGGISGYSSSAGSGGYITGGGGGSAGTGYYRAAVGTGQPAVGHKGGDGGSGGNGTYVRKNADEIVARGLGGGGGGGAATIDDWTNFDRGGFPGGYATSTGPGAGANGYTAGSNGYTCNGYSASSPWDYTANNLYVTIQFPRF